MTSSSAPREEILKDLLVFHDVARALASSLDLDSILHVIMKQMEQFFQPETWSLLIVDEQRNDLYFAVADGSASGGLKNVRVAMGEGIAGWVAEHGETLIVPDLGQDGRFRPPASGPAPGYKAAGAQSAICIPLKVRLKTLGVIQLFNFRLDTLTDYTISFLHVLCDYAAIAIENARAMQTIHELTITDDCTSLFNVRYLYQKLEEEIERSRRFKTPLSIIFIDLDHFKHINDQHGHLAGSKLLADVGKCIRSKVRTIDLTFRYGGDEFVVLLPSTGKRQTLEIARRLRETLNAAHFTVPEVGELKVCASFGVATYPDCGTTVHEIISQADRAMYTIKNSTRDGVATAHGDGLFPECPPQ
ncbi:MAG TPA: sensor domain-containing diguanylate cyclase [Acidisarcina sp.]